MIGFYIAILACCLLCLIGCRRTLTRILGLEELHAEHVIKSVRGAGTEPEAVQGARDNGS